jgi:hypothetical protein
MRYALLCILLTACSSHPVLPTTKDITVSRENPDASCELLGAVTGRSQKLNPTPEEVLEDLKAEAVRKGANYVKIETMGSLAASIRGTAFYCK